MPQVTTLNGLMPNISFFLYVSHRGYRRYCFFVPCKGIRFFFFFLYPGLLFPHKRRQEWLYIPQNSKFWGFNYASQMSVFLPDTSAQEWIEFRVQFLYFFRPTGKARSLVWSSLWHLEESLPLARGIVIIKTWYFPVANGTVGAFIPQRPEASEITIDLD